VSMVPDLHRFSLSYLWLQIESHPRELPSHPSTSGHMKRLQNRSPEEDSGGGQRKRGGFGETIPNSATISVNTSRPRYNTSRLRYNTCRLIDRATTHTHTHTHTLLSCRWSTPT